MRNLHIIMYSSFPKYSGGRENWLINILPAANPRGAALKTASGGTLTVMSNGPTNVLIKDDKGGMANINVSDVIQSNGVIHSIDKVLLPN